MAAISRTPHARACDATAGELHPARIPGHAADGPTGGGIYRPLGHRRAAGHARRRHPRFGRHDPVIEVTSDGTLEWGLPFFRGLAALVVLRGKLQPDGTMVVTRQVRGWVPRGPGPELNRTERFRRIAP